MPHEHRKPASDRASVTGDTPKPRRLAWMRHFESWLQNEIERDLTWRRQTMIAVAGVLIMVAVRLAAMAVIGSDLSFSVLFPVVLVATLIGGGPSGAATIVAGSLVALAFSAPNPMHEPFDALPRLTVWLFSSVIAVAAALWLRRSMLAVRRSQAELIRTAEQLQIVADELEHRGRNALAIVDALSREISDNVKTVQEYRTTLSSRIGALSAGYSFLTGKNKEPVLLGSLADEILDAFRTRIEVMDGPLVWLAPEACVAFALVVHELATNAVKYGALSVPRGRVAVSWKIEDNNRLTFRWSEHDGPRGPVQRYRGFGSRMIERAFNRIPGGSISSEWSEDGLIWRLALGYGPGGPSFPGHADRQGAPPGRARLQGGFDR